MVTAINLSLGIVTTVMAYLLGLPAPLLWGALAFGLNYIPYVGPAIMYVLLFVIGLVTYPTILGALLPPGIFMAITLIEGQFLTPAIVGRRCFRSIRCRSSSASHSGPGCGARWAHSWRRPS